MKWQNWDLNPSSLTLELPFLRYTVSVIVKLGESVKWKKKCFWKSLLEPSHHTRLCLGAVVSLVKCFPSLIHNFLRGKVLVLESGRRLSLELLVLSTSLAASQVAWPSPAG